MVLVRLGELEDSMMTEILGHRPCYSARDVSCGSNWMIVHSNIPRLNTQRTEIPDELTRR